MNAIETMVRDDQALRLATAVTRLRSALKSARWQVTDLSITQVSILRFLSRHGPSTASDLAAAEHITPQAVAQQLKGLKALGYVHAAPDPSDRRKTRISIDESGRALLAALLETSEAWLANAIEATVLPEELADLDRAIDVLERLANAVTAPER